jgi:amino acid transporter
MKMVDYINSLEYINWGMFILGGILFLISLLITAMDNIEDETNNTEETKKPQKKGISFLTVIVTLYFVTTITIYPYMQYMTVKENIKSFNNGKSLTCGSGFGIYSSGAKYIVYKDKDWSIRGDKFYNEKTDQIINALNCKEK